MDLVFRFAERRPTRRDREAAAFYIRGRLRALWGHPLCGTPRPRKPGTDIGGAALTGKASPGNTCVPVRPAGPRICRQQRDLEPTTSQELS